jgi:ParB-like chromosome segregation protein Spo0J
VRVPINSCVGHREGWRDRLYQEKVDHWRQQIREGFVIPAIRVDVVGDKYVIVDGHHRYVAHILEGITDIEARRNTGMKPL